MTRRLEGLPTKRKRQISFPARNRTVLELGEQNVEVVL
jgi:hypothetical protein